MIKKYRMVWLIAGFGLLAFLSIRFGPTVWRLAQDREALQEFVVSLGWFGPIALILGNAIQIVIAPIPGYVFQLAAGFLYGPLWGGIWGSIGLMTGAGLAMWLSRTYGRPLAERLVGAERLGKWESVTHSTNTLVWFALLLGPTGDIPYFLAGLSKVSYVKVMAITAILRIPSIFVVAGVGAGVMYLNWWQLAAIVALLTVVVVVFMRYQDEILARADGWTMEGIFARLGADRKLSQEKAQHQAKAKLSRDKV